VRGTSVHVTYHAVGGPRIGGDPRLELSYFSGGESHGRFVALFDADALTARFAALGHHEVTIYGEAYGGRCMGMRATYGDELRFIAFDVRVNSSPAFSTGEARLSVLALEIFHSLPRIVIQAPPKNIQPRQPEYFSPRAPRDREVALR
jgi:hypothetical protein